MHRLHIYFDQLIPNTVCPSRSPLAILPRNNETPNRPWKKPCIEFEGFRVDPHVGEGVGEGVISALLAVQFKLYNSEKGS